jgi:hypothetical protein
MVQFRFAPDTDTNDTFRRGEVLVSPRRLVTRFGSPKPVDGYKISGSYTFVDEFGTLLPSMVGHVSFDDGPGRDRFQTFPHLKHSGPVTRNIDFKLAAERRGGVQRHGDGLMESTCQGRAAAATLIRGFRASPHSGRPRPGPSRHYVGSHTQISGPHVSVATYKSCPDHHLCRSSRPVNESGRWRRGPRTVPVKDVRHRVKLR